jgi:UDP-N-acetylglucosamine--dolichyl-phosphate N-acetylglucosaminephosphotransferase
MYNTYLTIIVPSIIAFVVTLFGTRFVISYFSGAGVIAEDRNKEKTLRLPSSGGIAVAMGIIVGILTYTFGGSFIFNPSLSISNLLAIALSIILIAFVGLIDDINVREKRVNSTDIKDIRKGLDQWQKPLLTLLGALPLMAINAGIHHLYLPFIGLIYIGMLYPLIVIPLAVVFVSNSVNLLGGFDGLQPGMTAVASLGILIYSLFYGNYIGTFVSALLFVSIIAFLPFNTFRSRIIPGDSFTYAVGGTLVAIMVMGNAEIFGLIIFIPWIIEFFLHMRRKFKVTDLGIRQRDGTFKPPYGNKIYSLTHFVMSKKRMNEKDITYCLVAFEAVFVIIGLLLKVFGIL